MYVKHILTSDNRYGNLLGEEEKEGNRTAHNKQEQSATVVNDELQLNSFGNRSKTHKLERICFAALCWFIEL